MIGIFSRLDQQSSQVVEAIWADLETHCGLTGIQTIPYPHLTWLLVEDGDLAAIQAALVDIAAATPRLAARATGLGLFPGSLPVLYLPVVRTTALTTLHQHLWDQLAPCGSDPNPLYAPDRWAPHITVAYQDISPDNINCVMAQLAFQPLNLEFTLEDLQVFSNETQPSVTHAFPLAST